MAFIAIRSVIMCDHVEQDDKGTHIRSLYSDPVHAESNPGLVTCCLAIQVECDGKATSGQIELKAAGFEQCYPFKARKGDRLAAGALMVIVPVLRKGDLQITVANPDGGEILTTRWGLDFHRGAQVVGDNAVDEIVETAEKHAHVMAVAAAAQYRSA